MGLDCGLQFQPHFGYSRITAGWLADVGFMVFVGKAEHGTIPYLTQGRGRTNTHSSASLRDGIKIPLAEQGERAVGLLEK